MTKYKYYFYKPKSEVVKDIFRWLAAAGAVYIAASSPYFIRNLLRAWKRARKYSRRRLTNTFWRLKKEGLIEIRREGHQIYVGLTEEGKKKAGWMQIDELRIKRPKKWDGKWRLIIFDIAELKRIYREAFRGKLKELGFEPLQRSVWVHPFDCRDEIELLRDFFGLSEGEMRFVVAESIGDDTALREVFKL